MQISIGRLAAVVAVAGLTVVPFVSCSAGPLKFEFRGHEILRNVPPSIEERETKSVTATKNNTLFDGGDRWLHWVFIAATLAAVLAVFVERKVAAALAVGGLVATVAFLVGFNAMLNREMKKGASPTKVMDKDAPGMTLEVGAYLALLGFVGTAADGFVTRRRSDPAGSG